MTHACEEWHLTTDKIKGTLLEIPDLLPLINSFNSVTLKKEYKFKFCFLSDPQKGLTGNSCPWGVALTKNGNMLVVDHRGYQVSVFSPKGDFLTYFPPARGLINPIGIHVDPQNENIFVSEFGGGKVSCFDKDYNLINTFTGITSPYDITIDQQGTLFVACSSPEAIFSFTKGTSTAVKQRFPFRGPSSPRGIRIDQEGKFIICGIVQHCISIFSPEGDHIRDIGAEYLVSPYSLDLDSRGNIVVADETKHEMFGFTQEGELLFRFGQRGRQPGELNGPQAVVIDKNGNLIISEFQGQRISVFG